MSGGGACAAALRKVCGSNPARCGHGFHPWRSSAKHRRRRTCRVTQSLREEQSMSSSMYGRAFLDPDLIESRGAPPILAAMQRGIGVGLFSCQIQRLEGGPGRSATLRHFLHRCYKTRIGAFSYGACLAPRDFSEPRLDVLSSSRAMPRGDSTIHGDSHS